LGSANLDPVPRLCRVVSFVNQGMPQTDPKPTTAERYQLGEWIACGMP
jgi:hypothetical protein